MSQEDDRKIVKFNVGGTRYEVARSLIEMHPNAMLARMVSEQWQEDSCAEIFIERDGSRFKYVLDYLRDGNVLLPVSFAREKLLEELKYFCIEVSQPSAVSYCDWDGQYLFKGIGNINNELRAIDYELASLDRRKTLLTFSMKCLRFVFAKLCDREDSTDWTMKIKVGGEDSDRIEAEKVYGFVGKRTREGPNTKSTEFDDILKCECGLKLLEFTSDEQPPCYFTLVFALSDAV